MALGPPDPLYERQPVLGIQICRNQITYITPSRDAFFTKYPASRSPYDLSPPLALTFLKPLELAEKSQARPFGCSPDERWLKHEVYRLKPADRACWYEFSSRGVMHPLVVGSFTVQDSLGHDPSELRGAGLASGEFALRKPPATAPPPTLARASSASYFFLAITVTCFCCSLISSARACLARVYVRTASR